MPQRTISPPRQIGFPIFDPYLETDQTYDPGGFLQDTTDPKLIKTHRVNDALGRVIELDQAYNPSGVSGSTTRTVYDGLNHVRFLTAVGGFVAGVLKPDQVTEYDYGVRTTVTGGNAFTSAINSNDLLYSVDYPDPRTGQPGKTVNNQDIYQYDALGEAVEKRQRNGVFHDYTFDALGRQTSDFAIIPLNSGIDRSINQISTGYDSFGRPYLFISSGTPPRPGLPAPGNAVEREYNGFGQVIAEFQDHYRTSISFTGPNATSGVAYQYSSAFNGSRLTGIVYPDGRIVNYIYGPGLDSEISRVSSIADSSVPGVIVQSYQYLGLSTIVVTNDPEPGITLSYVDTGNNPQAIHDGGDQYTGLDRFGDVIDQYWTQAGNGSMPLDRFQYVYDQDGNVVDKYNLVNSKFSESYAYNNLNQLTLFNRSQLTPLTLNPVTHTFNTPTIVAGTVIRNQQFFLDMFGNWVQMYQSYQGDRSRTNPPTNPLKWGYNAQNLYTSPGFSNNADGDMTQTQEGTTKPATRNATYDAWDRMISDGLSNGPGGNGSGNYRYDALGRLITQQSIGGQAVTSTEELYVGLNGQALSEYQYGAKGTLSPYRDNIWGLGGANSLAMVAQAGTHGMTDARDLYPLQDALGNVTAVVGRLAPAFGLNEWVVKARYVYDPYGAVSFLNKDFGKYGAGDNKKSGLAFEYLFQGGRYNYGDGLYHFGSPGRTLDPFLGKWAQQDPMGYLAGMNLSQAMNGNPTTYTDPSGDWVLNAIGGVVGAVHGGIEAYYASGGDWGAVATAAALGGLFGAINPVGAIVGAAGAAIGAGIGYTVGGGESA